MTNRHFKLLLALAAALRLPLLFTQLWYDEDFTLILARLPFERMLAATAGDVHPPLWYLLNWLPYQLLPGLPVWGIRLFSFAASLACLVVLRQVLKSASPRLQTLTLVIMTLSPMQIYYASEGRMYALLCLLVLLAFWMIQERRWVLTCFVVLALIYTHNWGLFYAVTLGLAALVMWPEDADKIIGAFGMALIGWLPWAAVLLGQMQGINATYWIIGEVWLSILVMLYQLLLATTVIDPVTVAVVMAWLLIGIWIMRRNTVILLLTFMPCLLGLLVSLFWQPVMLSRAMIGSAPFLFILLAAALEKAWPANRQDLRRALVAAIGLLPICILGWWSLYTDIPRNSYRDEIAYVEAHWQPGDVIAFWGIDSQIDWQPYVDKPMFYVSPCQESRGTLSQTTRAAIGYQPIRWEKIDATRVWLLTAETPMMHKCVMDEQNAATRGAELISLRQPGLLASTSLYLVER